MIRMLCLCTLYIDIDLSLIPARETPHHGLRTNLAGSEMDFAEKVERVAKSQRKAGNGGKRGRGPKKRRQRPMERSKQPKEKEGQGELELKTVCWDPALPRCLKRSMTGANISFHGFHVEQKLIPSFPWMCSLKEAGFSGRHRCGVTLLSGNEYFDLCWFVLVWARCLCVVFYILFVCVLPEFLPDTV